MSEPEVDRIRALQRTKHYSIRAEEAHVQRAKRRIPFEVSQPVAKTAGPPALRQPFATLLESGHDLRTVEQLPGHLDAKGTKIDTHVLCLGASGVRRPLETVGLAAASPSPRDG